MYGMFLFSDNIHIYENIWQNTFMQLKYKIFQPQAVIVEHRHMYS